MRITEIAWRAAVLALLLAIAVELHAISGALDAVALPVRALTALAAAPRTPARAQTQAEWEAERDAQTRRFAEAILGPDGAKAALPKSKTSATSPPSPR